MSRNRPADIILDLLLGVPAPGQAVRHLIDAGRLFGFSENTIRVTLSRLVNRGTVESPERGWYHLAKHTDGVYDFVQRWRLGEARVRDWEAGCWLLAHLQTATKSNRWALQALGWREVRTGLFARPDNLAMSLDELAQVTASVGLDPDALVIPANVNSEASGWWAHWDPQQLSDNYRALTERLLRSTAQLGTLSSDDARLETFSLGGEVVHELAKDPLLPAEVIDVGARERLWREMLDYNALGRDIWKSAAREDMHMPAPRLASA